MGNHFVHGATTSKDVYIEKFVQGLESGRSFLLEFPDTIICNEVFAEYLREEKKEERNLWRLDIPD